MPIPHPPPFPFPPPTVSSFLPLPFQSCVNVNCDTLIFVLDSLLILMAKKEKLDQKRKKLSKEEAIAIKVAGSAWYQTMISDNNYTKFENFSKWLGVTQ
ncbi:hypothetical protein ACLOJK_007286 [Asimina triloba]